MNCNLKLAMAGVGLAGLLVLDPLAAAMKPGEYLNGSWSNVRVQGENGNRGITFTYLPSLESGARDGSGTLFGATFAYDNSGEDTWVTIEAQFLENQFEANGDILATEGGTFANPPIGVTQNDIGDATITLNSCDSIEVDFAFDDALSDLPDVTWELQPLGDAVGLPQGTQCPYEQEFTGCPDFAEEVEAVDRACALNGQILNQDITLTNDTTWFFVGLVEIGSSDRANPQSSTIRIEPGTVLTGPGAQQGSNDFLYVNPGSKIFANGTPTAPIVWTSPSDGFREGDFPDAGDIGGVVISGNAQCNSPEVDGRCRSEFDENLLYGRGPGENPLNDESSGEISYFQIRYGGIEFQPDREVNAWTFQGVGRGTNIHHIQAYRGADDGIEFFGGTAQVKYAVFSAGEDDGIDWDIGWSGKMQHALITYNNEFGGDHGFESANNPQNDDALPRAQPVLSNITVILDEADINNGSGIRYKEGTAGQTWNAVVTGSNNACLEFVDISTYDAAGTPENPSNLTAFAGTLLDSSGCPVVFKDEDGAPFPVQELFEAFPGNDVVDGLMLDGFQPMPGSPALGNGLQVFDLGTGEAVEWFDTTTYSGAFNGVDDWTKGWTFDIFGDAAAAQ